MDGQPLFPFPIDLLRQLDLLPHSTVNDRLMHILKNDPVFTVILDPLFVLVGFGTGLEVEDIAAILQQGQYLCDGGAVPFRWRLLLAFSGPLNPLLEPVGLRSEAAFPLKLGGDLLREKFLGQASNLDIVTAQTANSGLF